MGAPRWRSSMTIEEARQQAQAEGLVLLVAENKAGYFGVNHKPARPKKPYQANVILVFYLLLYFHKQLDLERRRCIVLSHRSQPERHLGVLFVGPSIAPAARGSRLPPAGVAVLLELVVVDGQCGIDERLATRLLLLRLLDRPLQKRRRLEPLAPAGRRRLVAAALPQLLLGALRVQPV